MEEYKNNNKNVEVNPKSPLEENENGEIATVEELMEAKGNLEKIQQLKKPEEKVSFLKEVGKYIKEKVVPTTVMVGGAVITFSAAYVYGVTLSDLDLSNLNNPAEHMDNITKSISMLSSLTAVVGSLITAKAYEKIKA